MVRSHPALAGRRIVTPLSGKSKPILFLDIDGVLSPFEDTDHHVNLSDNEAWFRVSEQQASWINRLLPVYECVWATWWLEKANEEYSPALGIPPLKTVNLLGCGITSKSPKHDSIREFAKGRPFVWLDDEIVDEDRAWVAKRRIPAMLVQPDFRVGATTEHFEAIHEFAKRLTTSLDIAEPMKYT